MNHNLLADLLLPEITKDIEYYREKYPSRNLDKKQIVTRFAPSPTGFIHMGSLYSAFVSSSFAANTNGVVFLRIEDTDKKREVENGIEGIVDDLKKYSINFDEGATIGGEYGPYIQSERKEIYQTFIKHLIREGLAYPCFCSEEELENIRKSQEANKERLGYYGKWAIGRNLTLEEIQSNLEQGKKYTIRLKSPGDFNRRITHMDLVKGKVEFPENDLDIVIMKGDGIPTYHFAHLVDDYLMGTTHVIRGDEWLSSVPVHLQLFQTFKLEPPKYAHISPIVKNDGGSRRKLSKRKDPEAAISFYHQKGIPEEAVKIYLATLTNTNFEEWYNQNPDKGLKDFDFTFEKMNASGALFDLDKLINISKTYFSRLSGEEVYAGALKYYIEYDKEFACIIERNKEHTINILNIERYIKKPRKDISAYEDIKEEIWYLFDELYLDKDENDLFKNNEADLEHETSILDEYIDKYYDKDDDKQTWFNKVKELAQNHGYAGSMKEYRDNQDSFKGHVGTICEYIRFALTSKTKTPDLYEILKLLDKDSIKKRFIKFKTFLNN